MKARVFPELRRNIIKILEEIYQTKGNTGHKYEKEDSKKVCSKHWWFTFMKKNTDIKELWETLPLGRMKSKMTLKKRQEDNGFTFNETLEESTEGEIKKTINLDHMERLLQNKTPVEMKKEEEDDENSIFHQSVVNGFKEEENTFTKMEEMKTSLNKKEENIEREASVQTPRLPLLLPSPQIHINSSLESLLHKRSLLDMQILYTVYQQNCQRININDFLK